jgi:hypothetical protein
MLVEIARQCNQYPEFQRDSSQVLLRFAVLCVLYAQTTALSLALTL